MATNPAPRARLTGERRFFLGMALAMAATAFVGFAPTYYLAALVREPKPPVPPSVHLHGALCTAWVLLLVAQTGLIAVRRADLHKVAGAAGVVLAAAILASGLFVGMHSVRRVHTDLTAGTHADPHVFFIFPVAAITIFALFALLGVLQRRRPDYHKRLMLLATMSLIGPALARISGQAGLPVVPAIGALLLIPLFVVALAIYDLRSRGRLHPATLWGGGFLLLSLPLRVAIGYTQPWHDFAATVMA